MLDIGNGLLELRIKFAQKYKADYESHVQQRSVIK